jgi:Cd2+/Zn2+-exporting ATPase
MTRAAQCQVCAVHTESTFHVDGMDCQEEVALLNRKLKALAGIESLSADVLAQRLVVAYDGAVLTSSSIAAAVAETGMRAWIDDQGVSSTRTHTDLGRRTWLVGLSAVAVLAGGALQLLAEASAPARLAFLAAILLGGAHPGRRALAAARARSFDINVLMAIAVAGALAIGDWFEAATVVCLFAIAQLLESASMERTRRTLRGFMDVTPREALVRRNGADARVGVDEVGVGDLVIVRPGERVPLDGEVVAGESEVNEAPVTGESVPVAKGPGARLHAGTVNGSGALELRVSRLGRDSTVARIIHLVERAQAQRAATQAFVDRFAAIYTPAVLAIAVFVAIVPPLVQGEGFVPWFYRALVLLVIACPCALVISTPVSIVSALTTAARRGVLVKGGVHLERLAAVRAMAFDKTGTLTSGRLSVVSVEPLDAVDPRELVALAAAVESHSRHPIGRAIVEAARGDAAPVALTSFRERPGHGVEGRVAGRFVRAGAPRLFESASWRRDDARTARIDALVAAHHDHGRTAVIVEVDERPIGVIALADTARPSAREALAELRAQGLGPLVMLTGDNERTAAVLARESGVDTFEANLMPEAKVEAVRRLREAHGRVAMVGDGINDAPALALADVGIAVGAAASDAALETADVALMADDLVRLPFAVRLSRATLWNIKTNIAFALGLKLIFLALAIAGVATLWMAVVADTGASLLVIANALRLLRIT